jgi:hypothetical protein
VVQLVFDGDGKLKDVISAGPASLMNAPSGAFFFPHHDLPLS